MAAIEEMAVQGRSFNPLTGISSILTLAEEALETGAPGGFNPLTGISSILTRKQPLGPPSNRWSFQSPDGDFVYSDSGTQSSSSPCGVYVSIP